MTVDKDIPQGQIPWDTAFKRFFSHAFLIKSLLQSFLDPDLVEKLDFDSLEACGTNFVTEDMRQLFGDTLWKIKLLHGSWMLCYVMIEFQRTVDKRMALRIAEYDLQLLQALLKAEEIDLDSGLPPVLPLLLNISGKRWTVAQSLDAMRIPYPKSLRPYQLQQSYLLIDARQMTKENADSLAKIVLASCDAKPTDLPALFNKALQLIISREDREILKRVFVDWFNTLLEYKGHEKLDNQLEIQEANKMIEDRIREWEEEVYNDGRLDMSNDMSAAMSDVLLSMGLSKDFVSQAMNTTLERIRNVNFQQRANS